MTRIPLRPPGPARSMALGGALVIACTVAAGATGGAAAATDPAGAATSAADARDAAASAIRADASARAVVDDRGTRVVFRAPVRRIVSLLPSLTETVCELGACDRLVGIDRQSDWPASVARLPRLGGGLDDVQLERIVALQPDVVLASTSARVLGRLEDLGLRVLAVDSNRLADTQRSIALLARVLGRPAAGDELIARIEARVAAAAARVPPGWRGATVYVEVAPTPHAASAGSFIGELLARLGLANIVPAALGPFPQLNPEAVVRARPDLIVAAQRPLAAMPGRPGWGAIPALQAGHACGFDERRYDVLVRPGPRVGEAAEMLADCIAGLGPRRDRP